jgi:hypothetical protein
MPFRKDSEVMGKLLSGAKNEYPILRDGNMMQDITYSYNPQKDSAGWLEAFHPDETGNEEYPIPSTKKEGMPAIEVYKENTTPNMIMGDAMHILANTDPIISDHKRQLMESMTPRQEEQMLNRYYRAQTHHNENRGYDKWREYSGNDALLRAYPMQQWGDNPKAYEESYTPEQRTRLDSMVKYLKAPR